jgi:hypothetical protein
MESNTAVAEAPAVAASKNGVRIVTAEKPLKINNPNLKLEISVTPKFPQFDSYEDAVNFAGDKAAVLDGLNTYVRSTVYANIRQKIRTAPEGAKVEDIVSGAESYGENWTFSQETAETVKKSELIDRQNKALAMLEAADRGEDVDTAAIIAMLRGAK